MTRQYTLPDGRKLDYAITGKADATPLLYFHGTPGACLPPPGIVAACEKQGLSVVSFSRPGYGSSTRQKGRTVIDTIPDAQALLKHLGFSRFYVAGWSGGGPYTLAAAAKVPGCIAALTIAGVGPSDAPDLDFLAGQGEDNIQEYNAAYKGEPALQEWMKPMRAEMLNADAKAIVDALASVLPEVDKKAILEDDQLGQYTVDSFAEALKHGTDGWADDDLAFIKPWGFDLNEIKVPVFLYQGDLDAMVPYAHGKWLAANVPEQYIKSHLQEGQGHVSIYLGQVDAMIKELVSVK